MKVPQKFSCLRHAVIIDAGRYKMCITVFVHGAKFNTGKLPALLLHPFLEEENRSPRIQKDHDCDHCKHPAANGKKKCRQDDIESTFDKEVGLFFKRKEC